MWFCFIFFGLCVFCSYPLRARVPFGRVCKWTGRDLCFLIKSIILLMERRSGDESLEVRGHVSRDWYLRWASEGAMGWGFIMSVPRCLENLEALSERLFPVNPVTDPFPPWSSYSVLLFGNLFPYACCLGGFLILYMEGGAEKCFKSAWWGLKTYSSRRDPCLFSGFLEETHPDFWSWR